MANGKGSGNYQGGKGRGMYSTLGTRSSMEVPMKGSELNLKMEIQGKGEPMVRKMAKEQMKDESHRGTSG